MDAIWQPLSVGAGLFWEALWALAFGVFLVITGAYMIYGAARQV